LRHPKEVIVTENDGDCQSVKYAGQIEATQLILDLYARLAGREFGLPLLARAGKPFDISEAAFRTALTRLKREGRVESTQRGRYRLIGRKSALLERVGAWREVQSRQKSWSGAWVVAIANPDARVDRTVWRRALRAFAFEGFRQVSPNIFARPNNLRGGVPGVRQRMSDLGVPQSILIASLGDLEETTVSQWMATWKIDEINDDLSSAITRLRKSIQRLEGKSDGNAAAETLLLGRRTVRTILENPLLPSEFGSENKLEQLIAIMSEYDVFGRDIWASYLQDNETWGDGSDPSTQIRL
jgi:phenylacetic acid degradation operon negative regulatory protein